MQYLHDKFQNAESVSSAFMQNLPKYSIGDMYIVSKCSIGALYLNAVLVPCI